MNDTLNISLKSFVLSSVLLPDNKKFREVKQSCGFADGYLNVCSTSITVPWSRDNNANGRSAHICQQLGPSHHLAPLCYTLLTQLT